MEFQHPSRRQDLLVGSLASTLFVCLGVWLSGSHPLSAQTPPAKPPDTLLTPLPFTPDDEPTPPAEADSAHRPETPSPAVPQLPDAPQAPRPDAITQRVEPPAPASTVDVRTIPADWGQSGAPMEVFDPSMLDVQPSPRVQTRPHYPDELKRDGISGEAVVDFIVDTSGTVRNATLVRASNPEFGAAAVAAVSRWSFKPGRKAGHPVFTHMQVPIEFTLDRAKP